MMNDSGPDQSSTGVLLVEDHLAMREILAEAIDRLSGFSVSGSVGSAEAALVFLETSGVDLVLVDMALPEVSGPQLIEMLRERDPDLPCLVFSGHREPQDVARAFEAGARGYVVKGNPQEIEPALRAVARGDTFVSTTIDQR